MPINVLAQTDATKISFQANTANATQPRPAADELAPAKAQIAVTDTAQISSAAKKAAEASDKSV